MGAPLTQTQVSTDSILDLNGKQTYLGNSFTLQTAGVSLTDTSEHLLCVIKNAAGSGKSLFLFNSVAMTNNNPYLVRYYLNPVLNSAGSTTVPLNLRTGATTVSVSTCYLGSTLTSSGTLLQTLPSTTYGNQSSPLIIIDPGSALLITGQQAGAGTSLAVSQNAWYEI